MTALFAILVLLVPIPTGLPALVPSEQPVTTPAARASADYSPNVQRARRWLRPRIKNRRQWRCLYRLWANESGWRVHAGNVNRAYGIPQAFPGAKMAAAERPKRGPLWDDWRHDALVQVSWGIRYVRGRYGTPCAALRFQSARGWY